MGAGNPPASNRGVKACEARRSRCAKWRLIGQNLRLQRRSGISVRKYRAEGYDSMKTDVRIDWIAATFPAGTNQFDAYPSEIYSAEWIECVPARGYTSARQFVPYGVTESINPDRPEMGIHVVYSGAALTRLAEKGVSPLTILTHIANAGGRCTRLDVALDVRDSGLNLAYMQNEFEAGNVRSNARKITPVGRIIGSQGTLYIGSRTSEAFMRVYDKAHEQGRGDEDWLRIELELKGSKARKAHNALLSESWIDYIPAIIRGFCDWPEYSRWSDIFDIEPEIMTTDKRHGSDTRTWVLEQVAPAIAKMQIVHGDEQLLSELVAAVHEHSERLRARLRKLDKA